MSKAYQKPESLSLWRHDQYCPGFWREAGAERSVSFRLLLFMLCSELVHGGMREKDSTGWQDWFQGTNQLLRPLLRKMGKEGGRLNLVLSLHQLRNDYMQRYASKVSEGMALQLGCLELRYVASRPL